jgi:F-type H+-transporting ATPase subunit delta
MADTATRDDLPADVSVQRLARVYAAALFAALDQAGQDPAPVLEEVDSLLDDVIRNNRALANLLAGAAVGRKTRHAAIEGAFAGRASPLFYNFLQVLNDHERLDLLPAIRAALHELDDARKNRRRVHVWSAVPLTDGERTTLADGLRRRFGFEPVIEPHVDPAVLGGLKVRVGDLQVDATVRTRLDNIRNQLLARSSYEIQSRRDRFRTD